MTRHSSCQQSITCFVLLSTRCTTGRVKHQKYLILFEALKYLNKDELLHMYRMSHKNCLIFVLK